MPGDGSPALAQKADNVELYKQLIDLSSQALDMQTEIAKLREENSELKKPKKQSKGLLGMNSHI